MLFWCVFYKTEIAYIFFIFSALTLSLLLTKIQIYFVLLPLYFIYIYLTHKDYIQSNNNQNIFITLPLLMEL